MFTPVSAGLVCDIMQETFDFTLQAFVVTGLH